jgi:hypothetical protein
MKKSFRGNAAFMQTYSTGAGEGIDHDHIKAEIGSPESGTVPSGAATDHQQIGAHFHIAHYHGAISSIMMAGKFSYHRYQQFLRIFQRINDHSQKSYGIGAVDHPVVKTEDNRHN